MADLRMLMWLVFSGTGNVSDYLRYKFFDKGLFDFEVGEEFGTDKDLGDSVKDDPLR